MPLVELIAPKESFTIFKNWIESSKPGRRRTSEHSYDENIPHKVYHTSVKDIFDGGGLQDAEVVSWRYYHKTPKGEHTLIEVEVGEKENVHHLLEAHYGPMAQEHKILHEKIVLLEEITKKDFELAFLRIFALKINAAWLKTSNYNDDFFIPIKPCFHGFIADKVYSYKEFIKMAENSTQNFISMTENRIDNEMMGG